MYKPPITNLIINNKKVLYLYDVMLYTVVWKMDECMIKLPAPSSGETREFIQHDRITVHYGYSLAVEW